MSDDISPEVLSEAKALGFIPKEEFRGDPEKWIDAQTFLERGKHIMPILKKNNEKLLADVNSLRGELAKVNAALGESRQAIEALKEYHSEDVKRQVEKAREELKTRLTKAREDGDVDSEVAIVGELQDLRTAEQAAEARAATREETQPPNYAETPEFKAWQAENAWFGPDRRKTALAMGIAEELRQKEPALQGKAFLDRVVAEVNETFGGTQRRADRVESGRNGGEGGGSTKSYADLPDDAKRACDRQVDRLVGPNRAFKTLADWRKHYVTSYFQETDK